MERTMDGRYSRQMLFSPIGTGGQQKLFASRVLIVGAGALGCANAEMLARSGVGNLTLIDRDYVELSNLGRQQLFTEDDAREQLPKAVAAKRRLTSINSDIRLQAIVGEFSYENAEELLRDQDLIVDCTDNFDTRFVINDAAMKFDVPWVYGAVVKSFGMSALLKKGATPCFQCMMETMPSDTMTCDTVGVIAPAVQMTASYQVAEALKYLVSGTVSGQLVSFDVWHYEQTHIHIASFKKEWCPSCGTSASHPYLTREKGLKTAVLCGRNTVQIRPEQNRRLPLREIGQRLKFAVEQVKGNDYLISFHTETHRIVLFQDGRALIHGTNDISEARAIYHRYIGV